MKLPVGEFGGFEVWSISITDGRSLYFRPEDALLGVRLPEHVNDPQKASEFCETVEAGTWYQHQVEMRTDISGCEDRLRKATEAKRELLTEVRGDSSRLTMEESEARIRQAALDLWHAREAADIIKDGNKRNSSKGLRE